LAGVGTEAEKEIRERVERESMVEGKRWPVWIMSINPLLTTVIWRCLNPRPHT
jgi:hypothetical protein